MAGLAETATVLKVWGDQRPAAAHGQPSEQAHLILTHPVRSLMQDPAHHVRDVEQGYARLSEKH
jgi:hypothetical protein